ncbi:MAG: class I SAM-dependent methyltransferase [Actinomycetota bacterium]
MDDGYTRLQAFLDGLKADLYPEPPSDLHRGIMRKAIDVLLAEFAPPPGAKVLDVGCGQGDALAMFAEAGLDPVGITLGEDYRNCLARGLAVREMDFSFLDFPDASFDVVWCRHALEHSPFPLFTLAELRRVMKPGAVLYVEVPAPDTCVHHERNPNHYSVFGKSAWAALFDKAKLALVRTFDIPFQLRAGTDVYWAFFLRIP